MKQGVLPYYILIVFIKGCEGNQQDIVEKNLNEYDIDIDRIHFMMRGH